jgi:hypothetical protein
MNVVMFYHSLAGEMRHHRERVLTDTDTARSLVGHGWERIRSRHACARRVDELLAVCKGLNQ